MDLLITGASGFLGSQIVTGWLARQPAARVICLMRGSTEMEARARLISALRAALVDQGLAIDQGMFARVDVIVGELADPTWIARAQAALRGPSEVVHCAANLSFRQSDRAQVWQTNVEGTRALLAALAAMPHIRAFNYVSTAYVAGNRDGDILEDDHSRPAEFHNAYEESKWEAERLVRETCAAAGLIWRIFRPSIIIAHSVTHRMSAMSGFYKVLETLMQMQGQLPDAEPIALAVPPGSTLDLIPVDAVVGTMLTLIARAGASANTTFHVTNTRPLMLGDVLRELSPMSGVPLQVSAPDAPMTRTAQFVMRRIRHYMPYFSTRRDFDQRNVPTGDHAASAAIDIDLLRAYVRSFIASRVGSGATPQG